MKKSFDINKFKVESWLPSVIKEYLIFHITYLKENINNSSIKVVIDKQMKGLWFFWKLFMRNDEGINRQVLWNTLASKDKAGTIKLLKYLLEIYPAVEEKKRKIVNDLIRQRQEDIEVVATLLHKLKDKKIERMLIRNCPAYIYNEYIPFEIHKRFVLSYADYVAHLEELKKKLISKKEFNNYIYDALPESRTKNIKNRNALLFMRQLAIQVRIYFNAPMNKEVASIINILFDTEYSANDVVKNTNKIRRCIIGESSQ